MKFAVLLLFLIFPVVSAFAQNDDADAAQQYIEWIRQAINEGRTGDAQAAINRALDFQDVNSDISFLAALFASESDSNRNDIVSFLDSAIEVNRWSYYSEHDALILKAQQLVAMRKFSSALAVLDQINEGEISRNSNADMLPLSADIAMLRLKAFRGIALNSNSVTELSAFRSITLSAMNRFSRDPRPARIFLEFLQGRDAAASDQPLLDLIIRRLPFLVESDPELAWMAASFMRNAEDTKRYIQAYRAGGFSGSRARDFMPNPGSLYLALNLGLINDANAIDELFSGTSGITIPLPSDITGKEFPVLVLKDIVNIYNMLGNEDARILFTRRLLDFSGYIISDDDNDGIIDSIAYYDHGIIKNLKYDKYQENEFDIYFSFDPDGLLSYAAVPVAGYDINANITWERYPLVKQVDLSKELFKFRPADFSYAPVEFITLGGSRNLAGILYPVLSDNSELTRRSLVSFCSGIERASFEFEDAVEQITLEDGIPQHAVEIFDGKIISVTEFDGGLPVIQYVDLDIDGRMETIRRFRRPGHDYPWPEPDEKFDYRKLLASSESDWRGDGRFKTGEVYLEDGSVVYQYDIDGTGVLNNNKAEQ